MNELAPNPVVQTKILYVENDPLDVMALKRAFAALGAELSIEISETAEQALKHLQQLAAGDMPDAMIVDLRMPGIGGLGLLERLRRHQNWSRIPCIVFSTSDLESERQAAIDAGAKDYLVKRIGNDVYADLLASVQRLTAPISSDS